MTGTGIQWVKGDRKVGGEEGKFKGTMHSLSQLEFKMSLTGSCLSTSFLAGVLFWQVVEPLGGGSSC